MPKRKLGMKCNKEFCKVRQSYRQEVKPVSDAGGESLRKLALSAQNLASRIPLDAKPLH